MNANRPILKKFAISFIGLILTVGCLAQAKYLGQLSEKYNEANKAYRERDLDLTLKLMNEIIDSQDTDSLEMAFALIRVGIIHSNYYDQFNRAIEYYNRAENYASSLSDQTPMATILMSRLWSYKYLREYDKALENGLGYVKKFAQDSNHYQLAAVYRAMVDIGYNSKMDLNQVYDWVQKMMYHSRLDTTGFNLPHSSATEARFYWEQGNLPKAARLLKSKLNLNEELDLTTLKSADVVTLKQLAMISLQSGDGNKAKAYLEALKSKFEKENDTKGFNYYELCLNLVDVYCKTGEYELAWNLIPRIQELTYSLELGKFRELILSIEKGRILTGLDRFDEAEKILHKVLIDINKVNPGPKTIYSNYDVLAQLMREKRDYKSAINYYNETLLIAKNEIENNTEHLADSYYELSKTHLENGDFKIASHMLDSAFYVNQGNETKVDDKFLNVHYPIRQLAMYELKLQLLEAWYSESGDKNYLLQGAQVSIQSNAFIEHQLRYTVSNKSKIELARSIYERSFIIATLCYQNALNNGFENALFYSDKLKSFFLKEHQFLKESIEELAINQELVSKRDSLQDLLYLNKDNPQLTLSIYEELDNASKKIGDHISYAGTSVKEIKNLVERHSILSYQIIDDKLYRIYKNDYGNVIDLVPFDQQTEQAVLDLREKITTQAELENNLSILSIKLIPPSLVSQSNLIIIPDGILNYLPFEILSFQDKWMFENFIISYQYSLKTSVPTNEKPNSSLLAVAPFFGSSNPNSSDIVRNTIEPLPGAQKEVNDIAEIFGGQLLTKDLATEMSFKNSAGNHAILHLATHAIVDDQNSDNSRLIFSQTSDGIDDGYLSTKEIAKLNLKAQLVTLSACNTGFGKIQKGEGVMSLSRAFAYAGVPSTIMSLWPASDKSTPELMKYFYQNLKDGQAKDVALNNARKQYLATAQGKARHPFYWGGFVLIGDNSPIEEDSNLLVWMLPILIVIVLIGTVLRRKNDTRARS